MTHGVESGFEEAISGIIGGLILSTVLDIIPTLPNLSSSYAPLFQLIPIINLIGSIIVIMAFESWGIWYLIGWLFGNGIMAYAGLLELWLMAIYLTAGFFVLFGKILAEARGYI